MNREKQLIAILEQIQSDLVDLQSSGEADNLTNFTEIGRFYDRMCANITDFEDLMEKEPLIYPELPLYPNLKLDNSVDLIIIKNAN